MTWGEEVGDLTEKDISAEEQDRLLSEYERELLTKKMKNGGGGEAKKGSSTVEDSIGEELAKLDMKEKKKGAKGATPAGRKAVSPDKGVRGRVSCVFLGIYRPSDVLTAYASKGWSNHFSNCPMF